MTVFYSDYVRVWIWPSNGVDLPASHVAVETMHKGQNTYMSCRWKSENNYRLIPVKEEDDGLEKGKSAKSYDLITLNVEKINRAYMKFSHPTASESLGWRILRPPFPKNPAEFTAYLLTQGGIESFHPNHTMQWINQVLKTIAFAGLFFSVTNRLSSYQFGCIANAYDTALKIEPGTLLSSEEAQTRLAYFAIGNTIHAAAVLELALEFLNQQTSVELKYRSILIARLAADTIKLSGLANNNLEERKRLYVMPNLRGAARECQEGTKQLSKVMFLISLISFSLLAIQRRIMQKPISSIRDIEWLVIKAVEKQERRLYNSKKRSLLYSAGCALLEALV